MALQQTYNTVAEPAQPTGNQFSDADINAYVQANIGNPQAIAQAAQQYGVSGDDLARATGYDINTVNTYFGNAGITPYWQQQAPQETTPVQPPPLPVQPTYNEQPEPIYEPMRPAPPTSLPELEIGRAHV